MEKGLRTSFFLFIKIYQRIKNKRFKNSVFERAEQLSSEVEGDFEYEILLQALY